MVGRRLRIARRGSTETIGLCRLVQAGKPGAFRILWIDSHDHGCVPWKVASESLSSPSEYERYFRCLFRGVMLVRSVMQFNDGATPNRVRRKPGSDGGSCALPSVTL